MIALSKTPNTMLALALVTALLGGCNERSSETTPAAAASTGSEHALPEPTEYADRLDDPARDAWQRPDEVISLLDCPAGATVADVGAGTGYFLPYLSAAVGADGRVLALDASAEMVDLLEARVEAESLTNVRPSLVPPDDPDLGRGSVDRILIVNTWHHIERRVAYATKLRSALKSGGTVLIVDFTAESPIGPPGSHRLTVDTVVDELGEAGLTVEVLPEALPHQYAVIGRP